MDIVATWFVFIIMNSGVGEYRQPCQSGIPRIAFDRKNTNNARKYINKTAIFRGLCAPNEGLPGALRAGFCEGPEANLEASGKIHGTTVNVAIAVGEQN
jgi:hypothetical protein